MLGTAEHPGRVRGQSRGVTQRDYFHKPARGGLRDLQKKQIEFERQSNIRHREEIEKLKESFMSKFEELSTKMAQMQANFGSHLKVNTPEVEAMIDTTPEVEAPIDPSHSHETPTPSIHSEPLKVNSLILFKKL